MQGIYREIQKEYDDSRKRALDEVEAKKQKLYTQNSELKNLDEQINKIGVDMTKSIIFIEDDKKRQEKIDELKRKIDELKNIQGKVSKSNLLKEINFGRVQKIEKIVFSGKGRDTDIVFLGEHDHKSIEGHKISALHKGGSVDIGCK